MPREFSRPQRVAEQLQRDLATLVQQELKDPRLGMVTIAAVDLSRDLAYATVYVTFLGRDSEAEIKESLKVLQGAAGFLRTMVGKGMRMRQTPHLKFKYDEAQARGRNLTSLIDQARKRDTENANPDETDSE